MSCHFPAHISRSEMLTFLLNFLSLLDQAPCLFVSPNEHHFTFDGYWIDHCCHGLWWPFVFIALPPNRLWDLFESAHTLFGASFIGWGEKEEMLWGFRIGGCSKVWGACTVVLAFIFWGAVLPWFLQRPAVLAALSARRTRLLWRVSSSARVRSSWSVAVSQPWHQGALSMGLCCCQKPSGSKRRILQPLGRGWEETSQVD